MPNYNFIDLTGQRFGRLTVIKRVEVPVKKGQRKRIKWLCKCDCGNEKIIGTDNLRWGGTKSCGCLSRQISSIIGKRKKKYNRYDLLGDYGIGYTSKNELFYFDLEDYNKIKDYCWFIDSNGYLVAKDEHHNNIKLHRKILNLEYGDNKCVDHINHDKMDNRKSNLRIVTNQQNMMNQKLKDCNTSGVTGVHWDNTNGYWVAQIGYNKQKIHIGNFSNFDEAVKARKKAEEKYFGEYSYNNSMDLAKIYLT